MKKENFISKFETKKYKIGSFDAYIDESNKLLQQKFNLEDDKVGDEIKKMPTVYRATILDENDEYLGFIGLLSSEDTKRSTNIRMITNKDLTNDEILEIQKPFLTWVQDSLNFQKVINIDTQELLIDNNQKFTTNIIFQNKMLEPGISEETIAIFSEKYKIPNMNFAHTIKSNGAIIAVIGLTNLIWSNQRANLQLFLNPSFNENEMIDSISKELINDYLDLVHGHNVHNISFEIPGDKEGLTNFVQDKTNMNFYTEIPYSSVNGDNLNSKMLFQHTPYMKNNENIYVPDNKSILTNSFETDKKNMNEEINNKNGFKLITPKLLLEQNDELFNKSLKKYTEAMQNDNVFTKPLGEDKYLLQLGNQYYGLTKMFNNYEYLVISDDNEFIGFTGILRNNFNRNADIEIGIVPDFQSKGYGSLVVDTFIKELYSVGFASVTAQIFDFNKKSLNMFNKFSQYSGIRLESYYINGKLYDMHYMTIINEDDSRKNRI